VTSQAHAWLGAWFAKRAPNIPLDDGDNFFDREAIDSFGIIELIEDAEQHFGIRFTERDFQDRRFPTVAGLGEIIASKLADAR
jgi:acyl carrier protein